MIKGFISNARYIVVNIKKKMKCFIKMVFLIMVFLIFFVAVVTTINFFLNLQMR